AVHAHPNAIWPAGGAGDAIVQIPNLQATRIAPFNPAVVNGGIPVARPRQVLAGNLAELARTILAMTDALASQSAPTIVGKAFRAVTLGNLFQQARNVLLVIGTIDAGDVEPAPAIGLAVVVDSKPVFVSVKKFLVCAARVHSRDEDDALGA